MRHKEMHRGTYEGEFTLNVVFLTVITLAKQNRQGKNNRDSLFAYNKETYI